MSNVRITQQSRALQANLLKFPVEAKRATERGQYLACQLIMLDAKRRCPSEDGDLEASGYVTRPSSTASNGRNVEMGFGGNNQTELYCVRQHEDLSLSHPPKYPKPGAKAPKVGEARFFANAIAAQQQVVMEVMADFVRRFIATGRVPSWPAKMVPETPNER